MMHMRLHVSRAIFFGFALLLFIFTSSCGRKGNPKPPELTAPSPVQFLVAKAEVDSIVLTWEAPETDASGNELFDLAGFAIKRNIFEENQRPRFQTVAEINYAPPKLPDFEELDKSRPFGLQSDKPRFPKPDVQFVFRDKEVTPGQRYDYLVVARNEDGVYGEPAGVIQVIFVGESSTIK